MLGSPDVREFDRRLAWLKQHEVPISQNPDELRCAWLEVAKIQPRAFLEIGSLAGGSLFVYAGALAPRSTIVAVDVRRSDDFAVQLHVVMDALRRERHHATWLEMPSHGEGTVEAVRDISRTFDVLHIDSNHHYNMVKGDFERYSPLVRDGGIVLLHDIEGAPGAKLFWEELKKQEMPIISWALGRTPGHDILSGLGMVRIRRGAKG